MLFKLADCSLLFKAPTEEIAQVATIHKDNTQWNYEKRPGMLYVVVRAVSVGTNGNGDHFTRAELEKSYKSFIGKGVFVNHASNDVEKKRGRIVDAKWCEERGDVFIKTVLEVNAEAHPDLAANIKSGIVDSVSMGCQVAYSNCSICQHAAKTTKDYCMHIKMHKGGAYNGRPVYEENHGIEFIEVSFVTVGADPQAKVLEVLARKNGLDFQSLLLKAAASNDPDYADNLRMAAFSIDKVVLAGIRRANEIRGTK